MPLDPRSAGCPPRWPVTPSCRGPDGSGNQRCRSGTQRPPHLWPPTPTLPRATTHNDQTIT